MFSGGEGSEDYVATNGATESFVSADDSVQWTIKRGRREGEWKNLPEISDLSTKLSNDALDYSVYRKSKEVLGFIF